MSNFPTDKALFIHQRYQILHLGLNYDEFTDSYIFAWNDLVYPLLDNDMNSSCSPHQLYESHFEITSTEVGKALDIFDSKWANKEPIDFHDVANSIYHNYHDQIRLSQICRYFFLSNTFDKEFWNNCNRSGNYTYLLI